ncbi:MAG: zinc-dependent metalloprotease [Actinomycetota bacterium]
MDDPFDLPPDVLRRVPLFAELSKVLSWSGGPINWDLARQVGVSIAAGENPAPAVDDADHAEVAEHVRIAELWLAETAGMPEAGHLVTARAATPADWADRAPSMFGELIEPISAKFSNAITSQMPGGAGPEAVIAQTIGQMAPMFIGIQAGTIMGTLAREVTGAHELGMPVSDDGLLIVLDTVDAIATEYRIDRRLVRQWVALRAAAHRTAFEGFHWLRAHFFAQYHDYVASLDVDLAQGMEQLRELDLSDPARLQEVLGERGGLFAAQPSPQTAAAAARIDRLLTLVDAHTTAASEEAGTRTGDAGRLAEAFARRAATGGAGRGLLRDFIGLDAPSNPRAAAIFVRAVLARGGWPRLNRMWDDPDALPAVEEISEPELWLRRVAG